ncbi:isoamylase early set domain-containing protein [uncultured Arcticibacterium sp.]|uniref:isoamylase early set domain-containing protein n=1 Tax=uncultured Arcticibacterium sp. TaxID=2173042 RepID=UPI0030F7A247
MAKKKVSFSLAAEIVGDATTGVLVGEFNNWDTRNGVELKKAKDGSLSCSVSLETGQTYQYRYLLDDGRWVNDGNADDYSFVGSYQVDNCVISVPKTVAKKTTKKVAAKPAAKTTKPVAKATKPAAKASKPAAKTTKPAAKAKAASSAK